MPDLAGRMAGILVSRRVQMPLLGEFRQRIQTVLVIFCCFDTLPLQAYTLSHKMVPILFLL